MYNRLSFAAEMPVTDRDSIGLPFRNHGGSRGWAQCEHRSRLWIPNGNGVRQAVLDSPLSHNLCTYFVIGNHDADTSINYFSEWHFSERQFLERQFLEWQFLEWQFLERHICRSDIFLSEGDSG